MSKVQKKVPEKAAPPEDERSPAAQARANARAKRRAAWAAETAKQPGRKAQEVDLVVPTSSSTMEPRRRTDR